MRSESTSIYHSCIMGSSWWSQNWIKWIDNEEYEWWWLIDEIFLLWLYSKEIHGISIGYKRCQSKVWLIVVFKLDIPSLTSEGIQMSKAFGEVRELVCSSMIDELLITEMLILSISSLVQVLFLRLNICYLFIHQYSGSQNSIKCKRFPILLNRLWFKEE